MPIQRPRILHAAQMAGKNVIAPRNLDVRAQGLSNRNVIINGAMNVAKRSTSVTGIGGSSGYFTIDRFRLACNTSGRLTMSQDASVPSGKGFANSLKLDCTTTDTSLGADELVTLNHRIEGQNLQGFCKGTSDAKSFAVSFYCKGNASATYVLEMQDKDNDRQISKSFNVTTSWEKVTLIFPADTTGTFNDDNAESMQFQIWLNAGSTYTSGTINSNAWASTTNANRVGSGTTNFFDSTDRTFFITGLQLEVGDVATEFEHEPFERTLLKCQRYYQRWQADTQYDGVCTGAMYSDTFWLGDYRLSPEMRTEPTFSVNGTFKINASGGDMNASNFGLNRATPQSIQIECDTTDANRIGQAGLLRAGADADAYCEFISEL